MKIELNSIPYWEVATKVDIDTKFKGRYDMVKAMKEIYPKVKEHLLVEDIERFEQAKNVPLHDAFDFFLEAVNRGLTKSNIIYSIEKDIDGIYQLMLYKENNVLDDYSVYWMPVTFLPDMKKYNKKYFDLFYALYAKLNRKGIFVHGDDGYDEFIIENLEIQLSDGEIDSDDPDMSNLIRELNLVKKYEDLFSYPKTSMSLEALKRKVNAIKPKFAAEAIFIEWLQLGIKTLEQYGDMGSLSWQAEQAFCAYHEIDIDDNCPDYMDGEPIKPYDLLRFVAFSDEYILEWEMQRISDTVGNCGEAEYSFMKEAETSHDLYDFEQSDDDMTEFLTCTKEFFEFGITNMETIHDFAIGDWKQKLFEIDNDTKEKLSTGSCLENISTAR